jgi:hypothetical protein
MFAVSVMFGAASPAFAAPRSNVVVLSQQQSEETQDQSYVGEPEDEELLSRHKSEQERQRALDCCNPCRRPPIQCGENILCGRRAGGACQ